MSKQDATPVATQAAPNVRPVKVSGDALKAYSTKMREWSGWPGATLVLGPTDESVSKYATTNTATQMFTANVDNLTLNPNRVINSVTPFRLRQEAVLTGALLHEAGHARHSRWGQHEANYPKPVVALARLCEEPRIEGLIARDAAKIGAVGLDWTMRASAAALLPTTDVSVDADQQVMDVITSYVLRAGRQYALIHHINHPYRQWVGKFQMLLGDVLTEHISQHGDSLFNGAADKVRYMLDELVCSDTATPDGDADTSDWMLKRAEKILKILFPETPADQMPMAGGGCGHADEQDDSESGGGAEGQPEAGEPGEAGASDGARAAEADSEGGADSDSAADGTDAAVAEAAQVTLAAQVRAAEAAAKSDTKAETAEKQAPGGVTGGDGGESGKMPRGYRQPNADERDTQRNAERFLRNLIDPSEASKVLLTESPSATVDGAALAAWKAGGQVRDPHFFVRTKRAVEPAPPVKIAVLVDVSGSMDVLQKPSALLSWALACAAVDLRNFAGRGRQVESCLIHWGTTARVVQRNGEVMPGIAEEQCYEGTYAMGDALLLAEEQMPGFLDPPSDGKPENRLLVQFTDWELSYQGRGESAVQVHRALMAGVNMLSVTPGDYTDRGSYLPEIIRSVPFMRGTSDVLKYNRMFPEQVWDTAAAVLGR